MKLLIMFLLTFAMFGQQVVTWNSEMDHVYLNGHIQYRATSDSATVKVVAVDSGEFITNGQFILAAIIVENRSGKRFDLLPSGFELTLLNPRKPPKALDYVPPEGVIKAIKHDLAWAAFGSGFASGLATRQQTTTSNTSGTATASGPGGTASGTFNGTTTTTTQVPNQQAQQQIAQNQRQHEQTAGSEMDAINQYSLRANTLEPGQEVKGVVFFKRDSSCGSRSGCNMKLVLPVGNTTFEFPVQLKKKP